MLSTTHRVMRPEPMQGLNELRHLQEVVEAG